MPSENMLLASLPARERKRLEPYLERVELKETQVLIEPDQPIQYVWFPYDAVTSTLQILKNGDAVEAGLMGLEGMVGIQLWLRVPSTPSQTLVQVPGYGLRMQAKHFIRQVMNVPESPLNPLIARYVHGFLMLTSQGAACNRMHEVDQRLCRWLRMVYNRVPERKEMPLRQEFLAEMLGVRRATVSTAASILQKAGYIEYSRGRLTILNPDGLAKGACECYELMEKQYDRIFSESWRPDNSAETSSKAAQQHSSSD
jgi:CRP-like cAMP-binding protein